MSSSSFSNLPDAQLAALSLSGDNHAFEAIVQRYSGPLYGYARRLTGNNADAEDIAQETFVRLFTHLPSLKTDQPLKPWLFTVCTNLCRNAAKRLGSTVFSALSQSTEDGDEISPLDYIADSAPLPDKILQDNITAANIHDAVNELPEKYGVIVALYYWDQLSYQEISTVLKLPLNTVRTRLRRGKESLSSKLRAIL